MPIVAARASCVLPTDISAYIISEYFKDNDVPGTLSSVPGSVPGPPATFPLRLQHMSPERGPGARLLVPVLYAVSKIDGPRGPREHPQLKQVPNSESGSKSSLCVTMVEPKIPPGSDFSLSSPSARFDIDFT
jgi:hypothetical protein